MQLPVPTALAQPARVATQSEHGILVSRVQPTCVFLVPQAVKGMPSEAVIGRWKETVRELGNILVQVSSSSADAQKMQLGCAAAFWPA